MLEFKLISRNIFSNILDKRCNWDLKTLHDLIRTHSIVVGGIWGKPGQVRGWASPFISPVLRYCSACTGKHTTPFWLFVHDWVIPLFLTLKIIFLTFIYEFIWAKHYSNLYVHCNLHENNVVQALLSFWILSKNTTSEGRQQKMTELECGSDTSAPTFQTNTWLEKFCWIWKKINFMALFLTF